MPKIGELVLDLKTNLAQFQQDMGRAAKTVEDTAQRINKITTGIQASIAGIGVGLLFKQMIDEAAGAELAFKKVQAVISATGGVAGVTAKQVTALSDQLEKLTAIDGDLITEAQSLMLTFTNISKDVFPRATKAMLDMSTVMGGDLKGAALTLGKALSDPINGLTALQRQGVRFTDSQKALIKSLVESGQLMKAQTMVLDLFNAKMGGAAETARNSLQGAMNALTLSFKNVLQALGESNASGLRFAIEALAKGLDAVEANADKVARVLEGITVAAASIVALKITKELQGIVQAITTLGKAGGSVAAGIAVAAAALVIFRDEVVGTERQVVLSADRTYGKIVTHQVTLGGLIIRSASNVVNALKPLVNASIGFSVTLGEALQDYWKLVVQFNTGLIGTVKALTPILQRFFGMNVEGLDRMLKSAQEVFSNFGNILKSDQGVVGKFARNMQKDWVGGFIQPALDWSDKLTKKILSLGKGGSGGKGGGGLAANMEEEWQKLIASATKHSEELDALMDDALGVKDAKFLKGLAGKDPEALKKLTEEAQALGMAWSKAAEAEGGLGLAIGGAAKKNIENLQAQIELLKMRNSKNAEGILQAEVDKEMLDYQHVSLSKQAEIREKLVRLKREEKSVEAVGEYEQKVDAMRRQADELERRVQGQGDLNEELRLTDEIEKNIWLTWEDKQKLKDEVSKQAQRVRALNEALEQHKRIIDRIVGSHDSFAQKIDKLGKAYQAGAINLDEYNDALNKVKDAQEKAKSSFQSFAEKVTSGFEDAITKGKKLTDVFKDLGKELLLMVAKKFLFEPIQQGIVGMLSKIFPTGQFGLTGAGGGFQFGGLNLGGLFNLFKGGNKAPGAPAVPGVNPPPGTPGAPGLAGMPPLAPGFNPAGGGMGTPGTSSFQGMGAFGPLVHTGNGGPAWKVYVVNQCPCPPGGGMGPLMATGNPLLSTVPGPAMQGLPGGGGGGYIPGGTSTRTTQQQSSGQFNFDPGMILGGLGGLLGGLLGGGMAQSAPRPGEAGWGGGAGPVLPKVRQQYGQIGGYSAQGRAEASMAMVNDAAASQAALKNTYPDVHPDLMAGWLQQNQASWQNAQLTQSYNGSGYYRPSPNAPGASYQSGWGSASNGAALSGIGQALSMMAPAAPEFRPGLTGGVNKTPMYGTVGSAAKGIWELPGANNVPLNTKGSPAQYGGYIPMGPAQYDWSGGGSPAVTGNPYSPSYVQDPDNIGRGSDLDKLLNNLANQTNANSAAMKKKQGVYARGPQSLAGFNKQSILDWIDADNGVSGYANGGRPAPNQISKVGERGPELFIPDSAGTVIPFEKVRQGNPPGGGMPNFKLINNTDVPMAQPEMQVVNGEPQLMLNRLVASGQSSYQARKQLKRNTNVVERPTRRS